MSAALDPISTPARFLHPAHPVRVDAIPLGEAWLYERTPPGARLQIHVSAGRATIFCLYGTRLAPIPAANRFAEGAPDCVITGYATIRLGRDAVVVASDLLECEGAAFADRPLIARKTRLAALLVSGQDAASGPTVRMLAHLLGSPRLQPPPPGFSTAKRLGARHRAGRSLDWVFTA